MDNSTNRNSYSNSDENIYSNKYTHFSASGYPKRLHTSGNCPNSNPNKRTAKKILGANKIMLVHTKSTDCPTNSGNVGVIYDGAMCFYMINTNISMPQYTTIPSVRDTPLWITKNAKSPLFIYHILCYYAVHTRLRV